MREESKKAKQTKKQTNANKLMDNVDVDVLPYVLCWTMISVMWKCTWCSVITVRTSNTLGIITFAIFFAAIQR